VHQANPGSEEAGIKLEAVVAKKKQKKKKPKTKTAMVGVDAAISSLWRRRKRHIPGHQKQICKVMKLKGRKAEVSTEGGTVTAQQMPPRFYGHRRSQGGWSEQDFILSGRRGQRIAS